MPLPLSPYGASKLAAEAYVRSWSAAHGVPNAVMRLGNIYGPRQTPHGEAGVVAIFSYRLWAGEPCTLFGHGSPTRDYVHVLDVVAALRAASGKSGIYNVGTGVETDVATLYARLAEAAGSTAEPALADLRTGRVAALVPGRLARPRRARLGTRGSRSPTASPARTRRWSAASGLPPESEA